jgi:curli biogenesis system outer membrane secretion channel CsgG
MKNPSLVIATMVLGVVLVAAGCGGIRPTRFVNPDFDFGFVEKIGVLPLENLTTDRQSAERATRMLITELLSTGAVDVVEPGEVETTFAHTVEGRGEPTREQLVAMGKELEAQALLIGSVAQSNEVRSGTVSIPVVTIDLRLVETDTGATVWAATHTERGSGAGAKFLGTGGEPISETTRKCIRTLIEELVE